MAEDGDEFVAEADACRRRASDRGCDKLVAAAFEVGAMADAIARRPIEDPYGALTVDQRPQAFAGLVPIDQKDERGADRVEECIAALLRIRCVAAGDEIEAVIVAEPLGAFPIETGPLHRKAIEQGDEEFCPGAMHVGVGDGDGETIDRDHQHVGVGRTDIVLDDEARAGPHDHRIEAGVIEFQRLRAREAAHERLDDRPVGGKNTVRMGPRNRLFGACGGEAVQHFVQVHHQPVDTVAVIGDGRYFRDAARLDFVALGRDFCLQRREPVRRCRREGLVSRLDGFDHDVEVVQKAADELAEAGRADLAGRRRPRRSEDRPDLRRIDAGRGTFGGKIVRIAGRVGRMPRNGLQRAHAHLGPIIRRQPFGDARRQQDFGFAELFDYARLHAVPSKSSDF